MWGSGLASCTKAAELSSGTAKRLLSDLKHLQEDPIPCAAAQPCSEKDLTLWDGVIGVEMEVTHFGHTTVPLHFLIDFPADYPQSAPNIGFSFEFEYRGGAQYVMTSGRLKGKKVICLDVLGNFDGIHTEWKNQVGTGWSPAYTVTTLLVQLQSVLCDLGRSMSQRERDVAHQSAVRFCERNPDRVLTILDEEQIRDQREERRQAAQITRACHGDARLVARVEEFARKARFFQDTERMNSFVSLLKDIAEKATVGADKRPTKTATGEEGPEEDEAGRESRVDTNIRCFATGKLYTEALLGVGVSRERRNLGTAGELLSLEAFNGGLRQSTNKTPFEFFLPVWINEAHAAHRPEWKEALRKSYLEMGEKVYGIPHQARKGARLSDAEEDSVILEVFPRLINQLIVEMMKPDAPKSEAIATFEAMCNFWRVLRWLLDSRPSLAERVLGLLKAFATDEQSRHKEVSPDLGVILVLFTLFQGKPGCVSRSRFVEAYLDENSVRWVMWWQRSGTKPEPMPVFKATKVSRDIFMFQLMVLDLIVKDPLAETLREMETSNCKLPQRLEALQAQWRARKDTTDTWGKYFDIIGASPSKEGTEWILETVKRAAEKGPKYGGSDGGWTGKGKDKGKDKGKGKGKETSGWKGWGR